MAGEVQQPFSLSFQVEALHSSSISFGRFELESLSWERRSSFSHNRYLDEVEKYAKPGSVTEKKAYFEAHFKKRALLRQTSSISQAEREGSHSDSSSYGTSICEENLRDSIHREERKQMAEDCNLCHFDESPKGSSHEGHVGVFEYDAGLIRNLQSESHTESFPSIDDTSVKCSSLEADFSGGEYDVNARSTDCLDLKQDLSVDSPSVEKLKCNEKETNVTESTEELVLMFNVQQHVDFGSQFSDQTLDVLKEQCISESTARGLNNQSSKVHTLPRTAKSVDKIRSSMLDVPLTCEREVKKGITRNNDWREKPIPTRVRAKKQMPESVGHTRQSSVRASKENPQNLNPKSAREKRSEIDIRPKRAVTPQPKRAVTPQPSTPERSESRRQRSAASSTQITSTRKEIGQSLMNSSFRSTVGAEKKRDTIMAADIRRLSKNPELNESQMLCSASKPVLRLSNREKPQLLASRILSAAALNKTLLSENQSTRGSKPCSASKIKTTVPPSQSAGSHSSSLVKESSCSSSTISRVKEANQRKEVVPAKERPDEKKPKAREHGQIRNRKCIEATHQDRLGRSSHGFPKKNMGHSSAGARHLLTITGTPKVEPVRTGNPFLRRSMGH
ncbi:hypothetical protein RND81_07G042500 [Saponaria officinalis]|uniref:TPX2 C-terminal domain-containing protein n=1 Tax=Saponaria officinalis TaxID=3572 RepID=A0AAW1JMU4_SAPOF